MTNPWFTQPINDTSLTQLFPSSVAEIDTRVGLLKKSVLDDVQRIVALPTAERTFENTAQAFDTIGKRVQRIATPLSALYIVSPQKEIRDAAHARIIELEEFLQKHVTKNVALFKAFESYCDGNAQKELLDSEQKYYLQESMKDFRRNGLMLPPDQLEKVRKLEHELTELALQFERNINDDATKVLCSERELDGVPAAVLARLKKDGNGLYIVGMDYPTYFAMRKFAKVAATRKKLFEAFQNRAYPVNEQLLKTIIQKRDELAKILGFGTYTAYDLDSQMAEKPETVTHFLDELIKKAHGKSNQEAKQLRELPVTPEDSRKKIQPWDLYYLKEYYQSHYLALDTAKIAEYFPVDHVVEQILAIYSNFLGLRFEPITITGFWHESVRCLKVFGTNNQLLGYLILDLYPRPNKYPHACMENIVSTIRSASFDTLRMNGGVEPAVILVVANLTPASKDAPGLLMFEEVHTFFHEFGHAMHGMLGATSMSGFSGTSVKRDFVEVPSQMFEEWLYDRDVLKKVSKHYKTGQPLPDETIVQLNKLPRFDIGDFILRQSVLSLYSLNLFQGFSKDIYGYFQQLLQQIRPNIQIDIQDHLPANFGHLTGYGAKYYSYLWSKVFAIDLFSAIKHRGLFDPAVGQDLVTKVLGKGGSAEPAELLQDFLGRPANQEAFLKYYGL